MKKEEKMGIFKEKLNGLNVACLSTGNPALFWHLFKKFCMSTGEFFIQNKAKVENTLDSPFKKIQT